MTKALTYAEAVEVLEGGASVFYFDGAECIYPFGCPTMALRKGVIARLIAAGIVEPWTARKAVEAGEFATVEEAGRYIGVTGTEYVYTQGY